jgi:predicted transcriptional regulator YheO
MNRDNEVLLASYKTIMRFMENLIPGPCELVLHKVEGESSYIDDIINPFISGSHH